MEQTALRPRPIPGQEPGATSPGPARRPHAARRRGRRLATLACGLLAGTVLVLSGVGLGAMGAAVTGAGGLAEPRRHPGAQESPARPAPARAIPSAAPAPVRPALGVEAVDADGSGARVVGVHVPGPGSTAGLVRGDVLLSFGGTPVASAADLARAVARARPGQEVPVTVRRFDGTHQRLTVTPGVVT
ncbi:PDZ domain-containing protein [Streptomyces kebangsaanensis]|uniref:PDZ domain-containing protein n=1 Tax=Streptomyces kebangsaanensis TaxID=864058 RepID=UPI00093B6B3A|nr:PDZ domain-containing protein [Streptomyces kebangsaanensis]